jgi:predicted AlkP superfamily pyrophosphatase or phosphodiesterase
MPLPRIPAPLALGLALASGSPAQAPAEPPALVVLVSVDQLAAWVFDELRPHLPAGGGFRRLLDHGVDFEACAFAHGCTETGPGHATIGTGAPAAVHGIVGNQWFDPASGRIVYCASSPGAAPVGGGPADRGPGTLGVPTFGQALKAADPQSRVVGLSLKDRSAILMAGHGADAALWFDAESGRFVTSTAFAATRPAWLERFEAVRPIARFFGANWDRQGPPGAYAGLVDDRPFEGRDPRGRRTLPQRIDGGLAAPGPAFHEHLACSPFGNRALLELAQAAIDAYQLGADAVPDLLAVGFSSTDLIGHRYGPGSVEVRDTLLRLDADLAALLRTLDARVGRGRYAVLLTSDHGVGPAPEARLASGLPSGRAVRHATIARSAAEKALRDAYGAPPADLERWVTAISGPWLHLDRAALDARGIDPAEAAARAAAALVGMPSVRSAVATAAPERIEDPELRALLAATFAAGRGGEVWIVVEPHWLTDPTPTASHGTPWAYDREVPLLGYGHRLRSGVRIGTPISPGTAVVLAAALCGIAPPPGARDPLPRDALR